MLYYYHCVQHGQHILQNEDKSRLGSEPEKYSTS